MNNDEQNEVSRALNEIWNDYLEDYGCPETMSSEDKEAASENLLYIASKWHDDGNQLMADGVAALASRYA